MITKKRRSINDDTPFADLAIDIEKEVNPIDLQSKVREFEIKRSSRREPLSGSAVIYDLREKLLSKADFKNLSADGVSFEMLPTGLKANDEVFIHFVSALNLGMVLCTVQWIRDLDRNKEKNKMVGLSFKKLTAIKLKMLNEFLSKLQQGRTQDPFYGS